MTGYGVSAANYWYEDSRRSNSISIDKALKNKLFAKVLTTIRSEKPDSRVYADLNDRYDFCYFRVEGATVEDCEKIGKMIDPNFSYLRDVMAMHYPFFISPLSPKGIIWRLEDVTEVI